MGVLEEMLVRNNLIYRKSDGTTAYVSDSLVSCGLTVTDAYGRVTHRVEPSTWPGEVVLRNVSTGLVEERIRMA